MGLIRSARDAIKGVASDQWKEYFYCDALPENVICARGVKRQSGRGNRGADNIISNGSVIAVADGQCMIIVDQGAVVDLCAEPGEYVYDLSTEPSIFYGSLSETIPAVLSNVAKRFTFGGTAAKEQRVYFFNTKELVGNKYGTPSPVPFRVVDKNIGLDVDISVRCFGEYSYRVTNPILFYTNVCGNVEEAYTRDRIDGQLKSELMTALQPAFARISEMGIRYSALPGHTQELADALNAVLSEKWDRLRGVQLVSVGVSSVTASEEDERMIKELQKSAVMRDPSMAAAALTGAQADAMRAAAANTAAGPAMAFMGMNMAQNAGGLNAQELFRMGAQQSVAAAPAAATAPAPAPEGWTCSCGRAGNVGAFCPECGAAKPAAQEGWTCACGAVNKGKFCPQCGRAKPAGAPLYKCDKCGWEPEDPKNPPKFCPECGDPFDENDIIS